MNMKKLILSIAFVAGLAGTSFSQVNPSAIGVRLGADNVGKGFEVSYQKGFGDANRLDLDLGLLSNTGVSGFSLFGGYHWNWNIVSTLNWYVGPGAMVSMVNVKNGDNYIGIGIGGQIGLEWDFQDLGAPILVSFDTRPLWNFSGGDDFGYGAALGVRYIF